MKKRIVLIALCLLLFGMAGKMMAQEKDVFAEIANRVPATRMELLYEPQPPELPDKKLPTDHDRKAVFAPMKIMSTKAELYEELKNMRENHAPFMQDLAPTLSSQRIVQPLNTFQWREETDSDKRDFLSVLQGKGDWEEVSIPHYGPPLGVKTTYYFKEFEVTPEMLAKGSLFVHFKGVDYIAQVFVNGYYLGEHEGFFAPFEFEFTDVAKEGKNTMLVKVDNDYRMQGNDDYAGNFHNGDKIFAASGPGYDEPEKGWHHCPPAMGIYQDAFIEARSTLFVHDIFVRPFIEKDSAEIWLEVYNTEVEEREIRVKHAVYGQNFEATVYKDAEYIPATVHVPGIGDLVKPTDWEGKILKMGRGVNFLKIPIAMPDARLWNTEKPWLYQLQIQITDTEGKVLDSDRCQFGMRSFTMDTESDMKGMMYLNGEPIRLRGANTMGHMQQCVMQKDWDQLRDDILLAKIANMNYYRLTQRPVQPEIYEYCDRLGLMTQTDLPLFGVLRRNQFSEAVKQAEEMERLVRNHPSNIMVTYINERFPNAEGNPHRHLDTYWDFERFFTAADQAVHMANPDRVIKAGDGDYDPPSPGLPDNHCYNGWYNGHGMGLGKMHKGFWQYVKPGWYYGCGEFGAEALDPVETMKKYYPKEWLPQTAAEADNWMPDKIALAQTSRFHYMWFNRQHTMEDWVEASQSHQEWAMRMTAEAFRRDNRMVSFAIHLFIDAWPAGWMKTIMDVDRQPKKAFFAYRNALQPLTVQLRTDRYDFFSGEKMPIEAWICNDLNEAPDGTVLRYQLERKGKPFLAHSAPASIPINNSAFQGFIDLDAPKVRKRTPYTLRLGLFDAEGKQLSETHVGLEVFPPKPQATGTAWVLGDAEGKAAQLAQALGLTVSKAANAQADVILIDDFKAFSAKKPEIDQAVANGKKVVFLELPKGKYTIGGDEINVIDCTMGSYYFVSPKTDHALVDDFQPLDFRFWYDPATDYVTPLLDEMFYAEGWQSVMLSGNTGWVGESGYAHAVAEKKVGQGSYLVSQVNLTGRVDHNPTARDFAGKLLGLW